MAHYIKSTIWKNNWLHIHVWKLNHALDRPSSCNFSLVGESHHHTQTHTKILIHLLCVSLDSTSLVSLSWNKKLQRYGFPLWNGTSVAFISGQIMRLVESKETHRMCMWKIIHLSYVLLNHRDGKQREVKFDIKGPYLDTVASPELVILCKYPICNYCIG